MRRLLLTACFALASATHAAPISLGLDASLNLLAFGNMNVGSSDVEGRVAVGGNATISGYSINTKTGSSALYSGTGLTVGGNLNFTNGTIWSGVSVGGSYVPNSSGNVFGGVSNGQGFDFAGEKQRLSSLSASLDAMANTGTVTDKWGTLHFDAAGQMLAVFDIVAADAMRNMQIDNLPTGAQILINIHGASIDFGNHGYLGFNKGQVLFNLPDATSLLMNGGINASVLALNASVAQGWGQVNGQVIVKDWNSSVQVNDAPMPSIGRPNSGSQAQPLPEPASLALVGLGLVAACFARRRRL
ncbi:choice-of-anchor A family protein [Roseateles asaccharophilus]|uniref:Choice-of-anchor A domain-containing protein n=1 Tax=Roseateles asaccharophilus TaxID=582607 RepID=A0ABU2AC53_9BURK|nr:choice-of-anchor A family protein [Roseateles asaccharophilus]MDR7334776.1 choice-of-anchor A domain-containing protein [Roseateles asaccharophilus]